MEKVIKEAIWQSYSDYRDEYGIASCEKWAHKWGWKEGVEWILTELLMNKKISKETMKKFMDEVDKINVGEA